MSFLGRLHGAFLPLLSLCAGLSACSTEQPSGSRPTCRANLGSVEILEVFDMDGQLHIAGSVWHHCNTPSSVSVRFRFFDSEGVSLGTRTANLTSGNVLAPATPTAYEWMTPMIDGVDSVTVMVVALTDAQAAPAK